MTESVIPKKRGRPAAFDYDTALQNAMHAFWQHGYEGTSMSTLMSVMDMNKASIYAAYGDKEALFQKSVERYVQGPASFIATALQQPTAVAAIRAFLEQAANMLTAEMHPAGCLITRGALACSAEAEKMQGFLSGYRNATEQQLKRRFERAQQEQDLPAAVDISALAKLIMTVHQGMTVQAVSGASGAELQAVVTMTLKMVETMCATT
jgi:AcrR family transcriptional regulator